MFADAQVTMLPTDEPLVIVTMAGEEVVIPLIPKGDRATLLFRAAEALRTLVGYVLAEGRDSYKDLCRDNRIGIVFTPTRFGIYVR